MKHFLDIADYSADEIQNLLTLADKLKKELKQGQARPLLKNKETKLADTCEL